jgi:hypothetical protein
MVTSSQPLMEHREKYERNKSSLMEVINNTNRNDRPKETVTKPPKKNNNNTTAGTMTLEKSDYSYDHCGREWLEKINNDIDTINKQQAKKKPINLKFAETGTNKSKTPNYSGKNIF